MQDCCMFIKILGIEASKYTSMKIDKNKGTKKHACLMHTNAQVGQFKIRQSKEA